ncbi:hypothetical protein ACIQWB_37690 [Streptomyces olivaceus]|uniref:hypothetical protein n=1 Tax=Streptomyces olivaceus TaxID=47716 RepID=UPI0038130442
MDRTETQKIMDVIEALGRIEDDAQCAVAATELLDNWPKLHGRLRELRQQRVQAMKHDGMTWAEIGTALGGISAARAQQIGAGHRGVKRPGAERDGAME